MISFSSLGTSVSLHTPIRARSFVPLKRWFPIQTLFGWTVDSIKHKWDYMIRILLVCCSYVPSIMFSHLTEQMTFKYALASLAHNMSYQWIALTAWSGQILPRNWNSFVSRVGSSIPTTTCQSFLLWLAWYSLLAPIIAVQELVPIGAHKVPKVMQVVTTNLASNPVIQRKGILGKSSTPLALSPHHSYFFSIASAHPCFWYLGQMASGFWLPCSPSSLSPSPSPLWDTVEYR